jgi:hypothetical protein
MLALRHRSTLGAAQTRCRDGKRNVDRPGGGSPALDRRSTPLFMRHTSQIAIVGAILNIAAALARNNGEYDNIGLVFVAIALALATAAALNLRIPIVEEHGKQFVRWAIAVAVVVESVLFFVQPIFSATMPRWIVPATAFLLCISALVAILGPWPPGKALAWLFVGTVFVFGAVTVHAHDRFVVDVRLFQHVGAQALLRGVDPYIVRYPNIYSRHFYGADNVGADGLLKVGFIYPPLIAFLGIPGVILGDVRFSHVLAMTGAAAALGFARPGRIAIGGVALFALMPRTVYFLAGGWSEPMSILLLFWTVWAAVHQAPRTTGLLAGLLVASKQYLLVSIPLFWLLASEHRNRARIGLAALLAALVVTVPLALWHPAEFFNSVVGFHMRQPFRIDSLSFMAAFARNTGAEPSRLAALIVIIVIGAASVVLAHRSPKTPSAFALSVALVVLGLFAFSQQAFVNYYVLAYAALCAALATSSPNAAENRLCRITK